MDPKQTLNQIINGNRLARAVQVAAHLALADHVHAGKDTNEELSAETGIDIWRLGRVMRYLTANGIFRRRDGRYSLTDVGSYLRSDIPGSLRPGAISSYYHYDAFGRLEEVLRKHQGGFEMANGKPMFDFINETPEFACAFDLYMNEIHRAETEAMTGGYDFGKFRCLMDVGGGNGEVLIHVLAANPDLRGCLIDLPHVAERAAPRIAGAGLAGRCEHIGASFFDPLPRTSDAILLRHVLHDWPEDDCVKILQHCREALDPGGTILIAEALIEDSDTMTLPIHLDLTMLSLFDAAERTLDEYRALVARAGLTIAAAVPITPALAIMEARAG